MVEAKATARYVRTSAQKAGLVLALIRGKDVNRALATLKFTRKGVASDIEKLLRSAIANAQQKDGFSGDQVEAALNLEWRVRDLTEKWKREVVERNLKETMSSWAFQWSMTENLAGVATTATVEPDS